MAVYGSCMEVAVSKIMSCESVFGSKDTVIGSKDTVVGSKDTMVSSKNTMVSSKNTVTGNIVSSSVLRVVMVIDSWREVVLCVHICMSVAWHVLCGLMMHGTSMGLVLELDVRLLLVIFIVVMTVCDVWLFVVHRMVVDDSRLVVMVDVLVMIGDLMVSSRVVYGHCLVHSKVLSSLNMNGLMTSSDSVFSGSVSVPNFMRKAMVAMRVAVIAVSITMITVGITMTTVDTVIAVGITMITTVGVA